MAYSKDRATRTFVGDIKDRVLGRVRVSLKTANGREAGRRHAALEALVRASRRDIVDRLRARRINIEAVTECYEAQRAWDTLLANEAWPTLAVAVTEYLTWVEVHPQRAESTYHMAKGRLTAIAALLGGAQHVDTITLDAVEGTADTPGLRAQLLETGIGDNTLAQYLRALGALYRWLQRREDRRALDDRRVPRRLHVPLDAELIPRVIAKRVRFLEPAEATQLLAATPARLQAVVGAGLFAGLRIDEALHLTPEDVDLELGILSVRPKPSPRRLNGLWQPKSRHSVRDIAIEPSLARLLAVHLDRYASAAWVFPHDARGVAPLGRPKMTHLMRDIVVDAGLAMPPRDPKAVSFHTLRHTFASWLVMEGVDLYTLSQLLGHADISEVQATYAHLSLDHRTRAIAKLGQRFTLPALPDGDDDADATDDADAIGPDATMSQPGTQDGA